MQASLVKHVSPSSCKWKVLARIGRIWENRDHATRKTIFDLGFIVVDYEGNTMEGCVPGNRIDQFRDQLKEGSVYTFETFIVAEPRKSYRTTDHPYRIKITKITKIQEIIPQPENFPLFAYNAKPFDVLETRTGENTFLSDVVGLVTILTDLIPSKTNQDPRRNIYLKNESGEPAIVTLWGEHAEAFDAKSLYEASFKETIIILFVGMAVTRFSGMLAFKSTSFTRWHVNIPIPEMKVVRESIKEHPYKIEWQGSGNTRAEPTETTLYDLAKKPREDIVQNRYKLALIITEVNRPHDWWFMSYQECWRKTTPDGNNYKCPNCRCTKGIERYKLSVKAKDIQPNEENAEVIGQFMFFGDHGVTLTGHDAILVVATAKGRTDYVPSAISNVVGKKCIVVAEVTQDALDADDITFHVSKSELISTINSGAAASSTSKISETQESTQIDCSENITDQPTGSTDPEATPAKEILETLDPDLEEDPQSMTQGKKRKHHGPPTTQAKKSSTDEKRQINKELFAAKKKA